MTMGMMIGVMVVRKRQRPRCSQEGRVAHTGSVVWILSDLDQHEVYNDVYNAVYNNVYNTHPATHPAAHTTKYTIKDHTGSLFTLS